MECLHCGKNIGRLRKFLDQEYCSDAHREAQRKKQNDLALDFLLKTKPRFAPEPRDDEQSDPVEATKAADTAQPVDIPQPAEFWTSLMPYAVPGGGAPQFYDAVLLVSAMALPEAEAYAPRATSSFDLLEAFSQTPLAAVSLPREICAVKSAPARFACQAVRVDTPGVLARPLWLGPSKLEPGRKQTGLPEPATFTKIRIDWNTATPRPVHSRIVAPFEQVVTNSAALKLPASRPVFGLASFLPKSPTHVRSAPVCKDHRLGAAWQFTLTTHELACGPVSQRRVIGFSLCPGSACFPLQTSFPATAKRTCMPDPAAFELRPPQTAAAVILRQPILALRSSQSIQPPAAARAVARKPGMGATYPAEFQIRLDTTRFGPVRPSNSSASPADSVPAARATEPESMESREPAIHGPSPDFRLRVATHWRRISGWAERTTAAAALLAVCGYAGSTYVRSPAGIRHRQMVQTQITHRAAIELEDDFRGGLSRWTGSAGWASSWSFDGTGTARCGKLALFEPSLSLTDYRVEFMGQIEKLAIAWAYRASDPNNYYATKLVETGRGPMRGLSLVRYAVIKGHQRMRVQLPLPVLPGKSMHRIRQEIRGAQFTTFLDGRLIDTWSDTSLARGGVGFFSDSGEVAYLRWVTIADQDDTLGRICAWLSPRLR